MLPTRRMRSKLENRYGEAHCLPSLVTLNDGRCSDHDEFWITLCNYRLIFISIFLIATKEIIVLLL